MAERNLSPAAERILAAAMELFARQGYEKTSVGEIQEAAGLTFGSGALYKHFRSKEAVLAEGVERFVDSARQDRKFLADLDGVEITEGLGIIARAAMRSFADDQDLLRIAWRDLEQFPDLQEKVRTERIRATFEQFGAWLASQGDRGRTPEQDSTAVAAVALSSLAFFQLLRFLLHDTPGGLDEERFVEAWTSIFGAALRSD
ncbi:MAG TPA: helix-turn-helix domain-containing protein [Acidimicrobiales bacterium]|jgi:AcrR family transcriptional regulator